MLACVGLLIGNERETRTWDWSSTLPVSWRGALASKFLVSTACCVIMLFALGIIPACSWLSGHRTTLPDWQTLLMFVLIYALALLDLFFFLTFVTLLFRETLHALIFGLGCYFIVLILVAGLSDSWSNGSSPSSFSSELLEGIVFVTLRLVFLFLTVLGTLAFFRWRWGSGQGIVLSVWRGDTRFAPTSLSGFRQAACSEFQALLVQSWHSTRTVLLSVVLAVIALSSYCTLAGDPWIPALPVIAALAAVVCGVLSFAGEQTSNRFRFLADRGVNPSKWILARILPTALFGIICVLIALHANDLRHWEYAHQRYFPTMHMICAISFLVGALSSICFQRATLALCIALLWTAGLGIAAVDLGRIDATKYDNVRSWLELFAGLTAWIIPVMLGASLWLLARRLLIDASPKLGRHFLWISVCLGCLTLPQVPWQGAPDSKPTRSTEPVPTLNDTTQPRLR
jgi:hypothetical protein